MKKNPDPIRDFGLYINGRRIQEEGLNLKINPHSGRVIGRAFLSSLESLLFNDHTPTIDEELPSASFRSDDA